MTAHRGLAPRRDMRRTLHGVGCVLLVLITVPAALGHGTDAALPASVRAVLHRYQIPADTLGVYVQDVSAAQPMLAFNADTPLNPASTMKLLTTFVALDALGPGYTWRTEAYTKGEVREGRLEGDLILKGYGDPFLVTERFWKFLRAIRAAGLRDIGGDVIADDSYFELPPPDPGAFDGRPFRTYNAPPNALLLNYHAIRFQFFPEPGSGRVRITADPRPATLTIDNALELTAGRCRGRKYRIRMYVQQRGEGAAVRFTGAYPASCGRHALTRTVMVGPPFVLGVFKSLWTELGGSIEGELRRGEADSEAEPYHVMESRPLAEIIRGVNKFSNNVMTRQLLLTLGAERYGPPGTVEKGRNAVGAWLLERGLRSPGLVLDNGAGLSRQARLSAGSLGRLLSYAYHHPFMPEFVSSLPLSAVDGTLRRRFVDEPLAGRLHVKTGQIDDVKAMAGYVLGQSGRTFVVAALQNHPGIHWGRGREVQDALLRWLFEQ